MILQNIDIKQHKEWMIESREYFELIFGFVDWIKGFSGDKPFNIMYQNTMDVYRELSKEEKYKNKMKFIIDRFGIA